MKFMKNFSMEAKAAIAFIIVQILFKIIFEFESSFIFAEATGMPAPIIIIVFAIIWAVICILCLFNLKISYLIAVIFGFVNLFPLILLALGVSPYPFRPYFNAWITFCVIIFNYLAYKSLKREET